MKKQPLNPQPENLGSIKLIGLGGTGGIVARYMAMYLTGLNAYVTVALIDGDKFEPKNAERMFFSDFGNKATIVVGDLLKSIGESSMLIYPVEQYITESNIEELIVDGDLVMLAVDNHATRLLVSDHCSTLDNVTLISGGNDGVGKDSAGHVVQGTYGNVQVHIRRDGEDITPSISAFHPEIANPTDVAPDDESCTDAIMSVPQIIFANLAAASAMLNAFYLHVCNDLGYDEVCFDIRAALMRPIELPKK